MNTPGAYSITPAGAGHAAVLAAVHADAFPDPWGAAEFADLLAMPGAAASIATVAGEPVGMIVWRHAGGEAEVLTLAVRPDHRRRGAGRCLLEDTMRALPGLVTDLLIEVAVGNEAARALYDAAGFEAVGRRPAYYAGREDALIMRRRLRSLGDADCMT